MEDTDFTGGIISNIIDLLKEHSNLAGLDIYEAEWLVTPLSSLPCLSVHDGEERNADSVEGTMGANVYELPIRITFYTAPTDDEGIAEELREARGIIKSIMFNATRDSLLDESVIRLDYISSKILPIYDLDARELFSNALICNYIAYYEVMKYD